MDITKQAAKAALGFKTDVKLAAFLGVSKQAVSAWGSDPLPDGRKWQLFALRPDIFGPAPEGEREKEQAA